jgi:hypothetical protein
MALTEEEVFQGFLALPHEKRVSLRFRMDEALIEQMEPQELEKCLDLAEARYQAYKSGKMKAIASEDVLKNLRAAIS